MPHSAPTTGCRARSSSARAQAFFDARGRGFSIWVRGDRPEDADLVAAAEAKGHQCAYEMPEMILGGPVEPPQLPVGVELLPLSSSKEAEEYWQVAATSYLSLGFPAEVFGSYTNHAGCSPRTSPPSSPTSTASRSASR